MKKLYVISNSKRKNKKYMVQEFINMKPSFKIHFGGFGYSDYTIHKDLKRKKLYELRHKKNENWNKSGINTAGFWSKHILWNKPDFKKSIDDTAKKFKIKIKTTF